MCSPSQTGVISLTWALCHVPAGLRSKLNAKSLCSSEQYQRGLSGARSPCTQRYCNETCSSCGASHPQLTLTLNFNDSFKKVL